MDHELKKKIPVAPPKVALLQNKRVWRSNRFLYAGVNMRGFESRDE